MRRFNDDQINIKLTRAEKDALKKYCIREDMSMSQVVRQVVRRAIEMQCK